MKNILIFVIIAIISITSVSAATISGGAYDEGLAKLKDVVIQVNSTPQQTVVSKDGNYAFTLQRGSYKITADYKGLAFVEENITIAQEGNYTLDLILFPVLEEVEEDTTELPEITAAETMFSPAYYVILIMVLILIFIIIKKIRRPKIISEAEKPAEETSKEDLNELISAIKKLGGRTTQKDLRKELPYSEAKISLMLTELEHKGKIERIKKGRGNIIILK